MIIPHYKEKKSFLDKFSDEDLLLSGWMRKEIDVMLGVFESVMIFVQAGNYLELGCGTGILSRFIHLFSEKKIIPHGIDINMKAIARAQENNPQFANNFILGDYFDYLKKTDFLGKFSTISIFLSGAENWRKAREDILTIADCYNETVLLICDYDTDLLVTKQKEVLQSISEFSKKHLTSVVNGSMAIVGGNPEMHKAARDMLKIIKDHPDCALRKDYIKLFTTGIVISKTDNQLCITGARQLKESFNLNTNTRFFIIKRVKNDFNIERVVRNEDIVVGDGVEVMFYKDRINIAVSVRKII
jgi:SAM-dependent methyltransferase